MDIPQFNQKDLNDYCVSVGSVFPLSHSTFISLSPSLSIFLYLPLYEYACSYILVYVCACVCK